jgi:hypothetical protein
MCACTRTWCRPGELAAAGSPTGVDVPPFAGALPLSSIGPPSTDAKIFAV